MEKQVGEYGWFTHHWSWHMPLWIVMRTWHFPSCLCAHVNVRNAATKFQSVCLYLWLLPHFFLSVQVSLMSSNRVQTREHDWIVETAGEWVRHDLMSIGNSILYSFKLIEVDSSTDTSQCPQLILSWLVISFTHPHGRILAHVSSLLRHLLKLKMYVSL